MSAIRLVWHDGRAGSPRWMCPPGCLPRDHLARWPHPLLTDGPTLLERIEGEVWPVAQCSELQTEGAA